MMRINKLAAAVLLGVSALGLSACATGLQTKVSRYQAMPAPQGQSFVVVPMNPNDMGGLEFSRYAELVAQRMQAQGYARAASVDQATMIVHLGYGVDDGNTEIVSDPFYGGYGGYGGWGYGRYGGGWGHGYYWGWNDPFWGAPYGSSIRSYVYYVSQLDLDIRRKVDNASLFEGKAKARSRTDELARLVPSLVDAMFTGFPGQSGETIKITIPNQPKQATAGY
ncbi:DUF4136 domain-containing protein [Sphingomonas sp. G124]|uniref:DUF4136 domain-containing protein n=1 Tax=Sphingomonas cremea TaxID=2904799 RepID=A0A9X1QHP2_9SPHN|nr:DUF4136 domain-containing protein [Sphingomonas cremea]MCF2513898.1 DUF4136 domain-containing protein [Sphingomonas cremea]